MAEDHQDFGVYHAPDRTVWLPVGGKGEVDPGNWTVSVLVFKPFVG